jgi:proton glutamate symport protein
VAAIDALGQLWLNALRMTIIPLVFALLVTGIASIADATSTGRLAVKALIVFAVLLVFATVYAFAASMGLHAVWPINIAEAQALLAGVSADQARRRERCRRVARVPSPAASGPLSRDWPPPTTIKAAADDAILAIVVFAIAFGFATTRLPGRLRQPIAIFFEAVAQAMIVIVQWVLWAAPVGVFALAMGVGLRAGIGGGGRAGPLYRHRQPGHHRPDPDPLCGGHRLGPDRPGPVRAGHRPRHRSWPSRPSRRWPACRSWWSGRWGG